MLDLERRQDNPRIAMFRDPDNVEQSYHLPGPPKIGRDAGDLMTYGGVPPAGSGIAGPLTSPTCCSSGRRSRDR
ncbi:MAG TPA: hypothetical protein VGD71_00730 [Kribbella sp.]